MQRKLFRQIIRLCHCQYTATECWEATKFEQFLHIAARKKQQGNVFRVALQVVSNLAADYVSPQERLQGWAKWQEDTTLMVLEVFGIQKCKQTPEKYRQQAKSWMDS